jgi:hypothetical protein
MKRLAFCAVLSLIVTEVSSQIAFGEPLDCNAPGGGALRPRVALNASGAPVVLWGRMSPNSNYIAIGEGADFTQPIEVSMPGCVPAVADWMGSSMAATGNTVWVVMKATPEESRPMYVRRSDDGGYSWGDTMRVDPVDGLVSRFPSIDLSDPDMPLVQYMQFDDGWSGARQVVTHLMGSMFMPPVQVSTPFAPGEVCDCCPNQIITNGVRTVALYRNAGSNIRVMWGATSDDHGASFPMGDIVDETNWNFNACPSSGPDGYLAGDSIRYVWMSGAENGLKIYLGSALASNLSAAPPRYVNPLQPSAQQQNYPRIAGSGDTLGVVWEQYSNGARDIYFAWSTTGVGGLSAPVMVNVDMTGSQRTPDIAYADGAFHIVWSEMGTNQVRYRCASLVIGSGLGELSPQNRFLGWPNPVVDIFQLPGVEWERAQVLDALGRTVHAKGPGRNLLSTEELLPGAYTLVLFDGIGLRRTLRFSKQ